jgi:hypothetical protein
MFAVCAWMQIAVSFLLAFCYQYEQMLVLQFNESNDYDYQNTR